METPMRHVGEIPAQVIADAVLAPELLDRRPFSRIALNVCRGEAPEGAPVLFWDGSDVEARLFRFHDRMRQELDWITDRFDGLDPFPQTVVDVGGGLGCFSLLAAKRFPDTTFVNLEINLEPLEAFTAEAKRLHRDNAYALIGSFLEPSTWKQIAELPKPVAVHTCASLYWMSRDQMRNLFHMMLDAGVTQGLHWEFQGWRTPTGKQLTRRFRGLVYRKMRLEIETDPYDIAQELRLIITDRVEVPPHFLGQHLPSFFAWRAK